ncbi:hypothetical protein CAEBREN_31545 [Caenorhabditis brenneri]|uniref:Major facilitator superfamily (MFS) profile domain-containing protein n=1 Tax=Caenorhabditis brenneri TaxID=135651 RepID=G0NHJ4_CAEBE|nr:hypothetical protein CAEBREN_31545 [Caenorhabditis brenneri]
MFGLSQPTWNICQLGTVFFFNFFSFFTLSALSQTIIESVAESEGINQHAGYYSAFLTYLVFTFGHFVATPIVEVITPKWSIVSGLVGYAMFEAAFLWMNEYFLYISAACAGFSGSLLWTGQFDYLAQNCQPHTLDRNSSNLWGISQISLIFGGSFLLILYRFQSQNDFSMPLIRIVVGSFLVCTMISIFIGFFLPKPVFKAEKYKVPYFRHLSEIVKISFDRNLLFLMFTFLYTGMELSFFSAVYPTMVSFTKQLGNTRDLNALASIFVGIGSVSGCFALSALGPRVREFGRKKMVLLAALLHMTCFLLSFLMFPDESPLKPTTDFGYIEPRRSASSCVVMFYSAHALLKTHLVVLSVFCVMATVTFFGIRVPEKCPVSPSTEILEIKDYRCRWEAGCHVSQVFTQMKRIGSMSRVS